MLALLASFAATAVFTGILLAWGRMRAVGFADSAPRGPQAFHVRAAPRLGGAAIYSALAIGALALELSGRTSEARLGSLVLACALPAFAAGLGEDLTESIAPSRRLLAIALSAVLAVIFIDASIHHTGLWGLDWIAAFPLGAAALAVFAVTGIANSINIIDGFNGLASMCATIMLLGLGMVASLVGDDTVTTLSLAGAGAVLGFFVWNFPRGLIFLGDGGAYLLGFLMAQLGIQLLLRNSEVSPLCPLLIVIYPVYETLFSMYRRRVLRGRAVLEPDGVHLHSLIYRRLTRRAVASEGEGAATLSNSLTAPYLWALNATAVVPAVAFWDDTAALGLWIVGFCWLYTALYWRLVRFRTPKALLMEKAPRQHPTADAASVEGDNRAQ